MQRSPVSTRLRTELEKYREPARDERPQTVSDIILEGKDEEIRHLQRLGIGLSSFFFLLWVGTMVLASLGKWPGHPTCI